ncbi:MAG: sterol desaturase family protein [Pseudomonadota bacterium]
MLDAVLTIAQSVGDKGLFIILGFSLLLLVITALRKGFKQTFSKKFFSGSAATIILYSMNVCTGIAITVFLFDISKLYSVISLPTIDPAFWDDVPIVLTFLAALVVKDFIDYWTHRWMHMRWLWPVHAAHHSEEEMTGLTTYRVHFLETYVMIISYVLGASWLGIPKEAIAGGGIIYLLHNAYVHADLDWEHGPFKYLLASPRFHRWHHANEPSVFGKNLANMMPIWDVLFGTYHNPHRCPHELGIDEIKHDDPVAIYFYPFKKWASELRAEFASSPAEGTAPLVDERQEPRSALQDPPARPYTTG